MKVLSLFDGISCGMVALERAGIQVEKYVAYEIEQSAIKISKHHYPMIEECGDVFKADFTEYQGFDLLIGGSPCTFWSVARKDRETTSDGFGFELFKQYVRAWKESGCKYFLYENNYSMHKDIRSEITKYLGVEPIMINSELVSAQSRKRLYWTNIPGVQQPKDKGIMLQDIIESGMVDRKKALCLTRRYAGFNGSQSYLCRRYFGKSFGQAIFEKDIEGIKEQWKLNPYFESDDKNIRQMTLRECERLQTLPDFYTDVDGVSDQMKYEAIGNGWTVDVIAHILSYIKIKEKEKKEMELKMNEFQLPGQILFNYEELKQELTEKVTHYENLVYTDEQIKEAKADKAALNKLKKSLNDERIRMEKEYMMPFNDFKSKVNEIISIIEKPIAAIDLQVKAYDDKQKQDKKDQIMALWDEMEKPAELKFDLVFEERMLNTSFNMKHVKTCFTDAIDKFNRDVKTLEELPEFGFEAKHVYFKTLDINLALAEGQRMAQIQKKKQEAEAEKARLKVEAEAKAAAAALENSMNPPVSEEAAQPDHEPENVDAVPKSETVQKAPAQWVKFQALLTTEDALALRDFFAKRNIEFKPV